MLVQAYCLTMKARCGGEEFVTRKITLHFAKIYLNLTNAPVELGNMETKCDWGYAGDYVEMMWKMLQQNKSDTYVIATGEMHSIKEFVMETGKYCGFDLEWKDEKENEVGIDKNTGKTIVKVNSKFYRSAEVELLIGSAEKAKKLLGCTASTRFEDLCKMVIEKDIERLK